MPACDYIYNLMVWVNSIIDDESKFPVSMDTIYSEDDSNATGKRDRCGSNNIQATIKSVLPYLPSPFETHGCFWPQDNA
ncbi:hypothetical protein AYI68_g4658 [Smittium mucronatum]|uniref:Uncharacterized protein n=1 Tax=Smittium mucronatum TaxID=133383 RepID=A0A1R0GWG8_9FUNG|nr:hypothetical protein AYI68_g4658 [Smittium mucronatum]